MSSSHHGSRVLVFQLLLWKLSPYGAHLTPLYIQFPWDHWGPSAEPLDPDHPHIPGQLLHT